MSVRNLDPVTTDDGSLIAASVGAPEQFAVIFDRHAPHIHRYLARRLGREAADDLVGETFLTAFRRRHTFRSEQKDARPWLYGIATLLISQRHRDEARELRLRQSVIAEGEQECHADRVAAGVSAQAMRPALAAALAGLSPGDRDVLLLIAWEELSYVEVAAALDIPVGTVRSRLNRARARVRAAVPHITFEENHE